MKTKREVERRISMYRFIRFIPQFAVAAVLLVGVARAQEKKVEGTIERTTNDHNQRVVELFDMGGRADIIPLAKQVLELLEKTLGPEHVDTADALNNLAIIYNATGDHTQALPLHQRALKIKEKVLGPRHPDTADSLNNLASLYHSMDDNERALPLFERALKIREKALGSKHLSTAISLNNLATVYKSMGNYARAQPLYERALKIKERSFGPEHPSIAIPLGKLAIIYQKLGDYARAEPLYIRALKIQEQYLGPDHSHSAITLSNLGVNYSNLGDFARAEPLLVRALKIKEKAHGRDHIDTADTLNNLAALYKTMGDNARALPLLVRALNIAEKAHGSEHSSTAISLNNVAMLHMSMGDYARAEPLFMRAIKIQEKVQGLEHPSVAIPLSNLAVLYMHMGNNERAVSLNKRALKIREKTIGVEHPSTAVSLNNLAMLYKSMGKWAEVLPLYTRVIKIWEKTLGPEHPNTATALSNLASAYDAVRDKARALSLHTRALKIQEKALGPEHPKILVLRHNLALHYQYKGDYAQAERLYRQVLKIGEKAYGPNHPYTEASLRNLTMLHWSQGAVDKALDLFIRGAAGREKFLALNLSAGSEKQKLKFWGTMATHSDIALSFHLEAMADNPIAARWALETVLRLKGRALDAMTQTMATFAKHAGPEENKLLRKLRDVRSQLSTFVFGRAKNLSSEMRQQTVARLEREQDSLERELSHKSAAFRVMAAPVTVDAVAGMLGNSALVEYVRYKPFSPNTRVVAPDARYAAAVLGLDESIKWVDLGPAKTIDAAVESFRKSIIGHRSNVVQTSRALDGLILQPLRRLIGNRTHIYIAPDSALNLVPFWALMDEQGRYAVETQALTYVTSGRDLLRQKERGISAMGPVAFADPAYDITTPAGAMPSSKLQTTVRGRRSTDLGKLRFLPLPDTRDEVEVAQAAFSDLITYFGTDATEEKFMQLNAPSLVIAATHGFFLPDQEIEMVGDGLKRGGGFSSGTSDETSVQFKGKVENPMLRAGLVFAGANDRQSVDGDGILTALEAGGINLWGTRLVVLSACETAVGETKTGQGIYGLKRSLVLAGSESQVLSLWSVDSKATTALMGNYYHRIQAGEGRSEAMRRAAQDMRAEEKWSHPFYWAAFVVNGDPRNLDGKEDAGPVKLPQVPAVSPGPRGCSCGAVGIHGKVNAWLLMALAFLGGIFVLRRQRQWKK